MKKENSYIRAYNANGKATHKVAWLPDRTISVAIDGPAGAGKSSISRYVARKLGFIYVDTGMLYRTVALYATVNPGVDIESNVHRIDIRVSYQNDDQIIYLCGKKVGKEIRTPEIARLASKVSALTKVREYLLDFQRDIVRENSAVIDGRDIGTVVLPNADVKIFLTASIQVRARRRFNEMVRKGLNVSYENVMKAVDDRDYKDMNRDISPLKRANDAVVLDTSNLSYIETVRAVIAIIKKGVSDK